ncbi:MAG TPA: DUF1015 domain-containing protein [Candidatus Hydrogenedentes bacterium]|nr:DUF1015 domain-containing protein [Candidatus Hydrogenedentota bacterium]
MAPVIAPFRAFRFDPAVTGPLDQVITPPYDVISPGEREQLARRSPYNMVHVILPRAEAGDTTPYSAAARVFSGWLADGALKQDTAPSWYLLRQDFTDPRGVRRVRHAFFARVKLPETGEKRILGHERTFDKPFEDRLQLIRAVEAVPGAVFVLYSDPDGKIQSVFDHCDRLPADAEFTTFEGTRQQLWRVPEQTLDVSALENQILYIADGHHRFRTACVYRDEMRAKTGLCDGRQPWDYTLMGFVAFEDPGLAVYPTHRLLPADYPLDPAAARNALEPWFSLEITNNGQIADLLDQVSGQGSFGLAWPDGSAWLLTFRGDRTALLGTGRHEAWRNLDVVLLHAGILERLLGVSPDTPLRYEKDAGAALAEVSSGRASAAFLLRATPPAQIRACAEAGEPMPQKSTYFFPKLPSGAVILVLRQPYE